MDKILKGTVVEVAPDYTRVAVDGPVAAHLQNQHFTHGSINQVPVELRVVGEKVKLTYRTTPAYGLWFVERTTP